MKNEILSILGRRIEIHGDDPDLVAPFLTVFDAFRRERGRPADAGVAAMPLRVEVNAAAGRFRAGDLEADLVEGPARAGQVYNLLYRALVRGLHDIYLIHAAVVARDGWAWAISGPSGSGKTSLGRALLARGFGLLSDDLAPLSVVDRLVHPFPRRVGIHAADLLGTATAPGLCLGEKAFVGAADLGLNVVSEPLPPGAVVIMNPYGSDGVARLTVGVMPDAEGIVSALGGEAGVSIRSRRRVSAAEIVEIDLAGGPAIAAAQAAVDRADPHVLFHFRGYGGTKSYVQRPEIETISTHAAALGLLRELLNREPRSALMQRHGGKLGSALFELVDLLAGVPCYRLRPAGIDATAELLTRTFSACVERS
ncbi:MAG: hypothetical protein ACE5IK_04680 [Acidobacteriota bacterium]